VANSKGIFTSAEITFHAMLRYEMFKRLNTGGSELAEQEIRNCTARMIGRPGVAFYEFIRKCAEFEPFMNCVSTLPDSSKEQKGDEELVLRFFALKNAQDLFKGSVTDWLDTYMERVIFKKSPFAYPEQEADFNRLFAYLNRVIGEGAFVRYRGQNPIGGLAPAHFEAVTLGMWRALERLDSAVADDE
jgi:hypothetical protein